ncbi:MAG: bifunctional hydroxymethylpyrimidine kinase/phosphomethylpyrimidine kinase [Planctomycetes bacterium]|nr:bifunctional hydroxymethylpyrimidine kinase/phosphomethylpyrimidine kinase [Planctomycetota bacterium]
MDFAVETLDRFPGQRILVLGDAMLDRYIWGDVSRISPEAPVQIVRIVRESETPGGAGNTAHNVVALDARAKVVGIAGEDEAGRALRTRLDVLGIEHRFVPDARPTTVKTRILARNQQLLRIDSEEPEAAAEAVERKLIDILREEAKHFEALIISDYAKGVVSGRVMEAVAGKFRIVTVDPAPENFRLYRDVTLLTPNHLEASRAAGVDERTEEDLLRIGEELVRRTRSGILITRGEKGMTFFQAGGAPLHVPTDAQEVIDVVGAGDTVISAVTLALAAGAGVEPAIRLSNVAAGIVVAKVGTAVASRDEIRARIRALERA